VDPSERDCTLQKPKACTMVYSAIYLGVRQALRISKARTARTGQAGLYWRALE